MRCTLTRSEDQQNEFALFTAMPRLSRAEVIDPRQVTIVHAINRTVRRCFLMGDDPISGTNFDHRKEWIETLLQHFAAHFGIDLLCYSILSNHYHLILRTRPDVVAEWDDTEVARRWLMICPQRKIGALPAQPTQMELNSIRNCPVKLAEARKRLSDVSWWMRLLNQRIAQRANKEDKAQGRFWQDRFRAIRIEDDESLLACAAYVELNPIRASIVKTLEQSEFTSVKRRIDSEVQASCSDPPENRPQPSVSPEQRRDAFLAKLSIDQRNDALRACVSDTGKRCSDKGFLSLSINDYIELLDWTARQIAPDKRGRTPASCPPILKRLGLVKDSWCSLVMQFEEVFCHVAGRVDRVASCRSHQTQRRFRVRPMARTLLPAPL